MPLCVYIFLHFYVYFCLNCLRLCILPHFIIFHLLSTSLTHIRFFLFHRAKKVESYKHVTQSRCLESPSTWSDFELTSSGSWRTSSSTRSPTPTSYWSVLITELPTSFLIPSSETQQTSFTLDIAFDQHRRTFWTWCHRRASSRGARGHGHWGRSSIDRSSCVTIGQASVPKGKKKKEEIKWK